MVLATILVGLTAPSAWAGTCVGGANNGNACTVHSECPSGYCDTVATPTPTATATPTPTATSTDFATPAATRTAPAPAPSPGHIGRNPKEVLRGSCVFNLPEIAAATYDVTPVVTRIPCPVSGASLGDTVFAVLQNYDGTGAALAYDALRLARCTVQVRNQLECFLEHSGASALDPAKLTIDYVVIR